MLADHGGPTETLALTPGSPALDTAQTTDESPGSDQRGFARVIGTSPDLGAYEAAHIPGGYPAWATEKMAPALDASFDGDSEFDTNKNGVEYGTGRNPALAEATDVLTITRMPKLGGGFEMHITLAYEPNAPDLKYIIQRNHDLTSFFDRYRFTPSTGVEQLHSSGNVTVTRDPTNKTITIVDAGITNAKYFWRLKVEKLP